MRCVRDEHALDRTPGLGENALDVLVVRRARIDHDEALAAEQIGVRARTGHEAGIVRDESADVRGDRVDLT